MLSEEVRRNLGLAAACTGGVAVLLFPATVITLGVGVALGYQCRQGIQAVLEGRKLF